MRLSYAATLLCLLPATLAQPAIAQSGRAPVYLSLMGEPFTGSKGVPPLSLWLAGADIDKDGAISVAELAADADRFFKLLDVDKDGRIGGEEMTRYEQEIAPAALRANAGLRPVGPEPTRTAVRSYQIDESGMPREGRAGLPGGMDGPRLSMQENPQYVQQGGFTGTASIPQPVAMTDTDMSGSVTPDEFTRAATRRFAAADTNKNGLLEASELSGRR